MAQIGRRLMVRDGCATPRATMAQPCDFSGSATKRNHGATARNHGATEAQPAAEDRSATAQPSPYKGAVRLRGCIELHARRAPRAARVGKS